MDGEKFLYGVTLFTFAVIFLLCYINKKFTFFEKNKMLRAPYPRFPFGNMHDVVFLKISMFMQLWKYYIRFKKKKCKSGGFFVFLKPAVLVVNPELTDTVLSQNNQYLQECNDRKCSDFNDKLEYSILNAVLKGFLGSWPSLTQSIITEEVNVTSVLNHYLLQVSLTEFFCLKSENENVLRLLQKELQGNSFSNFFKLTELAYFSSCSASQNKRNKKFCKFVEESVMNRKKNYVKKNDILQILVENKKSTDEIVDVMFTLAHHLRISINLILFLLYELSINEEIQDDLRGEIVRFKKVNKVVELVDLNELPYLETVVYETLRKYPVEPFMYKLCRKNYKHNGLNFSEDVLLFVSIFGIHHDAQNYINPELFDPDRFAIENEKFFNPSKFLPFGNKLKSNFDSHYIIMMMKLIVMDVLANVKISLGKKSPKSLKFDERSFRLKPRDAMWFKVEKL